ncbi:TonB-dependent siderophore receptor [Saccharospirillum mangrovi]|uniref:TonB-dependent siderophore receptor n=1 Tax=Saccharospirillum mangrovi TaxID=2161747 RepID=UPI000D334131|nr:TonB-dependent siderophore receptor [Saccharospirillum mangrovi]
MHAQAPFRLLPLIAAMAAAPLVMAETTETAESSTLNEVVIYGETYRNTATKSALDPQETPQGITVLDREALEMRDADSVASALRYAPGVNTELRGGAVSRMDLFNIRGFINYQNYYDGLQLLYNDWNLQPQVDLAAVEQVEVFKGPTSTLYGGMPPGGMVNLIGKQPSDDSEHQLSVATGSHHLVEGEVSSQGQIGASDFSYSLTGLARQKDGQAETSEEERYLIAPSVDWQASDNTLINVNLYYQNDPQMGIYSTVPAKGAFLDNPNGELPVDAYAGDINWETYEREVTMAGYKVNHEFGHGLTFLHNFRYTDATAYQENTYSTALAGDDRTLSRRAYLTDEATQGLAVDNQLSALFDTGPVEHSLLFGVDYLQLSSNIRYEDAAAPTIDLYDPDHDQIDPDSLDFAASGYSSDFDITKRQLGLYLQDQVRWDHLVVIGGVRYDDYEGTEEGRKYGAAVDAKLAQTNLSKRVGALYELGDFSPFVSYADSFEPVTGSDKDGNEFEPSTAVQWEAGVKFASADNATTANLSVYRINKTNVPTADPDGTAYDEIQAGEVRSQGVEFDLNIQPLAGLLVTLNYTFQDVEVTEDNSGLEGKTPVWVPEHLLSVWADYQFTQGALAGLNPGVGVRYIGEAQLDEENSDTVPSATLIDLSLGYDLGQRVSMLNGTQLGVSVNNLLDERYYSCFDADNCWFGAERTVEASVSYTF